MMGFLGRKKDYTELFRSEAMPEEKSVWIKNVSQLNALTQWGEALLRIEELFTGTVLYDPQQQPEVLKALHKLKLEWMKVDRQLVTVEEAVVLYDVLHTELPALIYRFSMLKATRASSMKNHEDDSLALQKKMEQLSTAVLTLRAKVDTHKLSRFTDLHPSPTAHLARLSWPVYGELPDEVNATLAELGKMWEAQKDNVTSVEDEYLMERIVTDYIPSSIHLYSPFISGSVEMEFTARTALLGQFAIIQGHLERVAETTFKERMKNVEAQTEFLKDRLNS